MSIDRATKTKRLGGTRRRAGWVLITLGLLIAALWGLSARWHFAYVWSRGSIDLYEGTVDVCLRDSEWLAAGFVVRPAVEWNWQVPSDVVNRVGRHSGVSRWWIAYAHEKWYSYQLDYACIVPWPVAAGFLVVGTGFWCWGWLAQRRALLAGHCPNCRYNLAGLPPGTPCPECGGGKT